MDRLPRQNPPPQAPTRSLWNPPPPNRNQRQRVPAVPAQAPQSTETAQPVVSSASPNRVPGLLPMPAQLARPSYQSANTGNNTANMREQGRGAERRMSLPLRRHEEGTADRTFASQRSPRMARPTQGRMEPYSSNNNPQRGPPPYSTAYHPQYPQNLRPRVFHEQLFPRYYGTREHRDVVDSWMKNNYNMECPGYKKVNTPIGDLENYWRGMALEESEKYVQMGMYNNWRLTVENSERPPSP
ncbi:hypothetical protein HYFRA_00012995 [Hymenoscyphus fraxineus]|uniref:Uncharacterized protein n=1 Tax=Hymenoscyphus fraxineus TaxID=746836 RepID=A0A9N9L7W3_9HELO|nr:hypothetical protein HYFRA_00012995 [Hymenoscyphus fraxineus]